MITVIICSVNPDYLSKLQVNIAATIGVPYELLAIDNRNSNKGICKVYNEAAAAAQYELLCFIHEDVLLHSKDWGLVLADVLSNQLAGVVGVSGTIYKSRYPASWVACRLGYYRINTLQHFRNKPGPVRSVVNPANETESEVVVVDGVFMACRKATWQDNPFDEKMLNGFHGYDLDWSISIGTKFQVVVTHRILLEHFSEGSFTREWINASFALHQKWKSSLPRNLLHRQKSDHLSDYMACSFVLRQLLNRGGSKKNVLRYFLPCLLLYFRYNRFKYTKTVLKYVLFHP